MKIFGVEVVKGGLEKICFGATIVGLACAVFVLGASLLAIAVETNSVTTINFIRAGLATLGAGLMGAVFGAYCTVKVWTPPEKNESEIVSVLDEELEP